MACHGVCGSSLYAHPTRASSYYLSRLALGCRFLPFGVQPTSCTVSVSLLVRKVVVARRLSFLRRLFALFYGPLCAATFAIMIAVLTTIIAPPHLFDDALQSEIDLASGAADPQAQDTHRKSFVKYFARIPKLCHGLRPISLVSIQYFQTQLRGLLSSMILTDLSCPLSCPPRPSTETGSVDRFHFFIAMFMETMETRPDVRIDVLLQVRLDSCSSLDWTQDFQRLEKRFGSASLDRKVQSPPLPLPLLCPPLIPHSD
jgi:hypothetical protein